MLTNQKYYLTGGIIEMEVAIMGAGISGLACAITLEKNGVNSKIFEKGGRVGDRFVNGEVLLDILNRPVQDSIASLSNDYGIYLKPTSAIQRMKLFSKSENAIIEGNLGYANIRGRHQDSFESQLEQQTNSTIHFNSKHTYERLLNEHTHVVMATGDGAYASENKNFRKDFFVSIKGVTVEGEFDLNTVMAWFDYSLSPYGYCYLIPYSRKEANISLAIPDLPANANENIGDLWNQFYSKIQDQLKQDFPITDQFQITRYPIGICQSSRIGILFT